MIARVDSIDGSAKQAVFGDRDPDIVIGADAIFVEDVRSPLTPAMLAEASAAPADPATQPTTSVTEAHDSSSAAVVASGEPRQVATDNNCVTDGVDRVVLDALDRVLTSPATLAAPPQLTAAEN